MTDNEMKQWLAKTEVLNKDNIISVGSIVQEMFGRTGTVVKINSTVDARSNGTVYVSTDGTNEFNEDTCDVYSYKNWHQVLRILK